MARSFAFAPLTRIEAGFAHYGYLKVDVLLLIVSNVPPLKLPKAGRLIERKARLVGTPR